VSARFFAIVNPAAGGGRCGKLAPQALERLREAGLDLEIAQTTHPGEAVALARDAYARGFREFLAVGGDGTSFEIVNGIFPEAATQGRAALGFLPLGTGNSFLRDFTKHGVDHAVDALREGRRRPCDVLRLRHAAGDVYFTNMVNLGFAAEAGEIANRKYKRWGHVGYVFGVFARLARLGYTAFPHRIEDAGEWDRRECLFLAFANSKFTGGTMMMAPDAVVADGLIEYVRCPPLGRLRLLWNFWRLFNGTHIRPQLASRAATSKVELDLDGPVITIIDGEVMHVQCRSVEVFPSALDVFV
jgi:diacylglycerol kinase (ATP)